MLFEQIRANKRNSVVLVILLLAVLFAVGWWINDVFNWKWTAFFLVATLIYFAATYDNAAESVIKALGGTLATKEQYPQLVRVVDELCVAAGLAMPKIYVIEDLEPNAFATGTSPENALIGVTDSLLEMMDENELRGVIAHEISHIRNYDIRLSTLAGSIVDMLVGLGVYGTYYLFIGFARCKAHGGFWGFVGQMLVALPFFACLVIGVVGVPLAKLISLLLSRQREYLADAGAVDLTRDASTIEGALVKLERYQNKLEDEPSYLLPDSHDNLTYNRLAFKQPYSQRFWVNLLSDHPSIKKRIKRLKRAAEVVKPKN